jgi:hypothetical protein
MPFLLPWLARRSLRFLHALGGLMGWLAYALSPSYRRRLKANATLAGVSAADRRAAVAAGYLLAASIAYSRLPVGAHSPVEAVAGLALGSLASGLALWAPQLPGMRPPAWLAVGMALWVLSLPVGAPPSPTHGWVVRLSMAVSDRAQPYSRHAMHRDHRRELKRQRAAQLSASAQPTLR